MILVTGGTGFVGRHLVRRLAAQGSPVRVLSRGPRRAVLPQTIELVGGDLADPSSLAGAASEVDVVIHVAAVLPGHRSGTNELEQVNVRGTAALAQEARKAGARRFIFVSSAGVYGEGETRRPHREDDSPQPVTPYQRSKVAGESVVREVLDGTGTGWVILRPTDIFGAEGAPTRAAFRRVRQRLPWVHGPCHALMQPVYVEDVVTAILCALNRESASGEVLNVGGRVPLDNEEWIALMGAALACQPRQVRLPQFTGAAARWAIGMLSGMGARPPHRLSRFGRRLANRTVNIEKARRVLGFEPVALEWALNQTATELREMGLLAGRAARPAKVKQ